jgi:hypothetical protein
MSSAISWKSFSLRCCSEVSQVGDVPDPQAAACSPSCSECRGQGASLRTAGAPLPAPGRRTRTRTAASETEALRPFPRCCCPADHRCGADEIQRAAPELSGGATPVVLTFFPSTRGGSPTNRSPRLRGCGGRANRLQGFAHAAAMRRTPRGHATVFPAELPADRPSSSRRPVAACTTRAPTRLHGVLVRRLTLARAGAARSA